jgi:hypothetical protein
MKVKVHIYKREKTIMFDTEEEADKEIEFRERVYGEICEMEIDHETE